MTTSEDPWKGIRPPDDAALISARRIDPSLPWDLFWAVDGERHSLLVLRHTTDPPPPRRLPRLRGLRVEAQTVSRGEQILVRLLDREQSEIFYRFCLDVVQATTLAKTEQEAVERFLGRTWRWHRLLRSGRDAKLTAERQRGLIGELRLIEKHLIPLLGPTTAVRCWVGPLDAPRDFEIASVHLEAKTRGPAQNAVVVSSEQQLDSAGCDRLFLHVAQIAAATEGPEGGMSVTDAARRVQSAIEAQDPLAGELFEERLFATGLDWEHDYSDQPWLVTSETLFEVVDEFPRITPNMLPAGVENVSYRLAIAECRGYEVDVAVLAAAVAGASDDD